MNQTSTPTLAPSQLNRNKCLVIYSGGLDSTVLLYDVVQNFDRKNVSAISFNYGQRHVKELQAAQKITTDLEVPWDVIGMSSLGNHLSSCLTSRGQADCEPDFIEDVPKGHYEDKSMRSTVVPNRNMIMISIAAGIAISNNVGCIAIGAHSGDHVIYPDCREVFIQNVQKALDSCWYEKLRLCHPFIYKDKSDIVVLGTTYEVPFESTWSCYEGGDIHCGECGTCVERKEAFIEAGIPDPTEYVI